METRDGSDRHLPHMLILIFLLLSAGCRDKADVGGNAGKLETVRIAAFKGELATLVWVADGEGLFAKHGLDARVTGFESGVAAVDAVVAGTQDVATAAEFAFVSHTLAGNSTMRILSEINRSESIEILARADRGIASPADLRGKRIAVTRGSAAEYFLYLYLLFHHLDPQSVTIVDLPPPQLVGAISQGSVDAAITWQPNVWKIQQELAGAVLSWPAQSDQQFYFLLLCETEFAEKRLHAVIKMIRALNDAETLVRREPARARRIVGRRLALDERYLASVWSKHTFGLTLEQALLVFMEDQARWAAAEGFAPAGRSLNYLKSLYQEPLASVKPDAVTLYR